MFVLHIEDSLDNMTAGHDCTYRIEDCLKNLSEITETVYPVALCRKYNKLFILNCARSGYNGITPGVVEFGMEDLDILVNEADRQANHHNRTNFNPYDRKSPNGYDIRNQSIHEAKGNSYESHYDRPYVKTPYDLQRHIN